jgi:hypothetical protein
VLSARSLSVSLPVQIEYSHERWTIGLDAGYLLVDGAADQWLVAPYATWTAAAPLVLMAVVFAIGIPNGAGTLFGFTGGLQWSFGGGFALLASAGSGIESIGAARLDWKAYVGIQYEFRLFGQSAPGFARRSASGMPGTNRASN